MMNKIINIYQYNKLWSLFLFQLILVWTGIPDKVHSQHWRSSLYPEYWYFGYADDKGRFLHDFSFAGYHSGEKEFQALENNIIDVTNSPYYADPYGYEDSTDAIQKALDDVGLEGGGVVYLPIGTYRLSVPEDRNTALQIRYSNTVLRGAGKQVTRLVNTTSSMREKSIILIAGEQVMNWHQDEFNVTRISKDLRGPTVAIPVSNTTDYRVDDLIVIRSDVTYDFISDHNMEGGWSTDLPGVTFYRRIIDIDHARGYLFIDAPTRYYLRTRDNARIYKVNDPIDEVGLEHFSIGNFQNLKSGFSETDYTFSNTGGYEVHYSYAIRVRGAINSWISDISTFRPDFNKDDIHVLSGGIELYHSRHITIENSEFRKPQFIGGGGNGYMYSINANDCLLRYNIAGQARHNFSFNNMSSSGNVLYRCTGEESRFSTDFHMYLSMANLIDNFIVDGDYLAASYRGEHGYNNKHGQVTTQSVFWNTKGLRYHSRYEFIIFSQQFGHGYVIGTRGPASMVRVWGGEGTEPLDFEEGVGKGDYLVPESLYDDQLTRRLAGNGIPYRLHDEDIVVYPNPFSDYLNVFKESGFTNLRMVSLSGAKVNEFNFAFPVIYHKFSTSDLDSGIYILIHTLNGQANGVKVIKR